MGGAVEVWAVCGGFGGIGVDVGFHRHLTHRRNPPPTDLLDLPENVRRELSVTLAERVEDALAVGKCVGVW